MPELHQRTHDKKQRMNTLATFGILFLCIAAVNGQFHWQRKVTGVNGLFFSAIAYNRSYDAFTGRSLTPLSVVVVIGRNCTTIGTANVTYDMEVLDAETGITLWNASIGTLNWAAADPLYKGPVLRVVDGIAILSNASHVVAIDLFTGERRWTRPISSSTFVTVVLPDIDANGRSETRVLDNKTSFVALVEAGWDPTINATTEWNVSVVCAETGVSLIGDPPLRFFNHSITPLSLCIDDNAQVLVANFGLHTTGYDLTSNGRLLWTEEESSAILMAAGSERSIVCNGHGSAFVFGSTSDWGTLVSGRAVKTGKQEFSFDQPSLNATGWCKPNSDTLYVVGTNVTSQTPLTLGLSLGPRGASVRTLNSEASLPWNSNYGCIPNNFDLPSTANPRASNTWFNIQFGNGQQPNVVQLYDATTGSLLWHQTVSSFGDGAFNSANTIQYVNVSMGHNSTAFAASLFSVHSGKLLTPTPNAWVWTPPGQNPGDACEISALSARTKSYGRRTVVVWSVMMTYNISPEADGCASVVTHVALLEENGGPV